MNSVTLRAICVLGLLISAGELSGCANGRSASHASAVPQDTRTGVASRAASASAGTTGVCAMTQRDLTTAMNDLRITDFSGWAWSLRTGYVVGGATMTNDRSRLTDAFKTTATLMNTLGSSPRPVAKAVGEDLSDTGGDFEDLISGQGTVSDQAVIVHAFSNAVAAAVAACGPDSFTRYAPAQETALDDLAGIGDDYSSDLGSFASVISQTRADLAQEKHLAALGPQGDGGSCTVADQMSRAAQEIGQGDGGNFTQDLGVFTTSVALTQRYLSRLQADLSTIETQRLTPPATATAAMARAQQAIGHAIAIANKRIDAENALISESFSLASAMAKIPSTSTSNGSYSGSCAGYGPGNVGPFLVRNIT